MSHRGPSTPDLAHLAHSATRPSLLILASYLVGIVLLFRWTLRRSILPPARLGSRLGKEQRQASPPKLWIVLIFVSFASTWFFMFRYFYWSYSNYLSLSHLTGVVVPSIPSCNGLGSLPCLASHAIARLDRLAQWLDNTSLFEEAWLLVTREALPWWWSVEICTITVGSWTLFLRTEGNRLGIPHLWTYMLLGQAVAISVAANLFNLALSLRPAPSGSLMIAHSNRQASDPFGAEHLLEAVEMRRKDDIGRGSGGRMPSMERTPSQKAMPPPPLPVSPSGTRTSRSVRTASVLPLPSQLPSLQSRLTLTILILGGLVTVFKIPTSLASILVMHSFPLILTFRCPVPHAMGERKILPRGFGKWVRESLAPSRVHLLLGLAALTLKAQTTLSAWSSIHLDAIEAVQRGLPHAIPHATGHELAVPSPTVLSLVEALGRSFLSNPARSSISSDAVCIALTSLFFVLSDSRRLRASLSTSSALEAGKLDGLASLATALAMLTPLLGPSAVFSLYLAKREALMEEAERRDEEVLLAQAGMEDEEAPQLVVRERRVSTTVKTTQAQAVSASTTTTKTSTDLISGVSLGPPVTTQASTDEGGSSGRRGATRSPRARRSLGEELGIVDKPTAASAGIAPLGVGAGQEPPSPTSSTSSAGRRRRVKREVSDESAEGGEEEEEEEEGEEGRPKSPRTARGRKGGGATARGTGRTRRKRS